MFMATEMQTCVSFLSLFEASRRVKFSSLQSVMTVTREKLSLSASIEIAKALH